MCFGRAPRGDGVPAPHPCTGDAGAGLGASSRIPGSGQAPLAADGEGRCSAPGARCPSRPFPCSPWGHPGTGDASPSPAARSGTAPDRDSEDRDTRQRRRQDTAGARVWYPRSPKAREGLQPPSPAAREGRGAAARSRVVTAEWQLRRGAEPSPAAIFSCSRSAFSLTVSPRQSSLGPSSGDVYPAWHPIGCDTAVAGRGDGWQRGRGCCGHGKGRRRARCDAEHLGEFSLSAAAPRDDLPWDS